MYEAKVIADSVSPDGVRLVTMQVTYPRIVHAEMMTHRVFSRNAASSRAIPVEKMIQSVEENPYVPEQWDKNGRGMQGHGILEHPASLYAEEQWLAARDDAVRRARALLDIGVHKQLTNRLLEPFLWYTCIITSTEWSNFFHLRCHADAHPAIQHTAKCMKAIYNENKPQVVPWGDWHCPYVPLDEDLDVGDAIKISAARCARVSYLTHDGVRDVSKDIELHDRLISGGHLSPTEHVAQANGHSFHEYQISNFRKPWLQYRKTIPYEDDILGARQ